MADVKWIKVVPNIFEDQKMQLIEGHKNADAILIIWFKLLCLAGRLNNGGVFIVGKVPYTVKMFADAFHRKEQLVKEALYIFEQYEMIDIIDGVVALTNWDKYQTLDALEKKRERDKEYKAKQREIVKKSSDSRRTSDDMYAQKSSCVASLDIERDKDIKEKERVKEKAHAPKHKHGEYKNVLLTDEELAKLKAEYPADYESMIDNLSSYLASKKVSYQSHYAVMRRWAKADKQKTEVKGKPAYAANNPFLQYEKSDTDYAALEKQLIEN